MNRATSIQLAADLAAAIRPVLAGVTVTVESNPLRVAAAATYGKCVVISTRPPSTEWETQTVCAATHELQVIFAYGDDHTGMWEALDSATVAAAQALGIDSTAPCEFELPGGAKYSGFEIKIEKTYHI